jgi:hypothetical protein
MAHELGHALLGPRAHELFGIIAEYIKSPRYRADAILTALAFAQLQKPLEMSNAATDFLAHRPDGGEKDDCDCN